MEKLREEAMVWSRHKRERDKNGRGGGNYVERYSLQEGQNEYRKERSNFLLIYWNPAS